MRAEREFPRAWRLLSSLPRERILEWLSEYAIGRAALAKLEARLVGRSDSGKI